jgi:hypothetical protein
MLSIIFWVAVGAVIGWNLPQPTWAANAQKKVVDFFNGIL